MLHRRPYSAYLALLLAALFFSSCARTRPFTPAEADLPSAFPNHTIVQIERLLAERSDTTRSFRARAALSLTSPEQSGRFTAEIRERVGDSLFLSISPGLGIEAINVLITRDSAFVYDRISNRVQFGSIDEADAILPVPIGGGALGKNLRGQIEPHFGADWTLHADSTTYLAVSPSRMERYRIDPALWRIIHYERRDSEGDVIEERIYEDHANVEGSVIPRRVVFRRPLEETTVVLTYREIDVHPTSMSFDLRVRQGARWIPVGD